MTTTTGPSGRQVKPQIETAPNLAGAGQTFSVYRSPASRLICVTGDQGSGKTFLITTLPAGWRVHLIDIDGGFEGARQQWCTAHKLEDIAVVGVANFRQLHAAMWSLPNGYNAYAIDTYTLGMQRFKRQASKARNVDPTEPTNWKKIGGDVSSWAIDYFDQWCEQVYNNNAWGIVMCQEKTEGEDNPKIVPALVGQARSYVAGYVNELFHMEKRIKVQGGVRTWERVLRTKDTPEVLAKDRSLALDEYEPADLAHIIHKIEEHRATATQGTLGAIVQQLTKE